MSSSIPTKTYTMRDLCSVDLKLAPSLDLPDLDVRGFFCPYDGSDYMHFHAMPKKHVIPSVCPKCGHNDWKGAGVGDRRLVHDIMRYDKRVDIVIWPKRFECKHCGAKVTPPIDGIERRVQATTRLVKHIKKECLLRTLTELVETTGFDLSTIEGYLEKEIAKYDAERKKNPLPAPRILGIDEKHTDNFMCGTFVDIERGRLLDMVPDNKADTMIKAVKRLKNWDANIKVVTTDMNNAYSKWLKELLPNAMIVIDKFHVIQDLTKKISPVRSKLYAYRQELTNQVEDPEERVYHMDLLREIARDFRIFNYSLETLKRDEKERAAIAIANIIREFPEFRLLRLLYYRLEMLYQCETLEEAELAWEAWMNELPPGGDRQYEEWCILHDVPEKMFDEFRSLSRSGFTRFKDCILNYFRPGCRFTNATTEAINNVIEEVDRASRGLSFKYIRGKVLYAHLVRNKVRQTFELSSIPDRNCPYTNTMSMLTAINTQTPIMVREVVEPNLIEPVCAFISNKALLDMLSREGVEDPRYHFTFDENTLTDFFDPHVIAYVEEDVIGARDGKVRYGADEGKDYNFFDEYFGYERDGDKGEICVDTPSRDNIGQNDFQTVKAREYNEKYKNMTMEEKNAAILEEFLKGHEQKD